MEALPRFQSNSAARSSPLSYFTVPVLLVGSSGIFFHTPNQPISTRHRKKYYFTELVCNNVNSRLSFPVKVHLFIFSPIHKYAHLLYEKKCVKLSYIQDYYMYFGGCKIGRHTSHTQKKREKKVFLENT